MYLRFPVLVLAVMLLSLTAVSGQEVKVGDITLQVPAGWKQSPPTSNLRLAQFEIPAAAGEQPGELAVFAFGGAAGGVQANIKRWIEQFRPEGRQTKITKGKTAKGEYVLVDVSGTYNKPVGPPIAGKTEPMENARMLAAILQFGGPADYFLKLTGGKQTVTDAANAFRGSFGGKADEEKPVEFN